MISRVHVVDRAVMALSACCLFLGLFWFKADSDGWTLLAVIGLVSWCLGRFWPNPAWSGVSRDVRIWCGLCMSLLVVGVLAWAVNGADIEQAKALSSPYGKFVLVPLVVPALMFWVRDDPSRMRRGVWIMAAVGAICAVLVAIDQRWGGPGATTWDLWPLDFTFEDEPRAHGVVNPIYFGNIALLLGWLALLGSYARWRVSRAWLWLVLGVVAWGAGMAASALSLSRGGWIVLPVLLLLAFWQVIRDTGARWLVGLLAVLAVAAAAVVTTPGNFLSERITNAADEIQSFEVGQQDTSIGNRLRMWMHAVDMIAERPVLGHGPDSFRYVAQPSDFMFYHAHNDYLNVTVSLGFVGLLVLLALYLFPLTVFWRRWRRSDGSNEEQVWALGGVMVVLGYASFSLTDVMFYRSVGTIFYLCAVTLCLLGISNKRRAVTEAPTGRGGLAGTRQPERRGVTGAANRAERRVLLVCQDNIGDLVFTSSPVAALAQAWGPALVLDVLSRQDTRDVARLLPHVRAVLPEPLLSRLPPWPWSARRNAFEQAEARIRAGAYDVAILVGKNWRLGLLCWRAGIPVRIGYARPRLKPWLSHPVPLPDLKVPVVRALMPLLAPLGVPQAADAPPYGLDAERVVTARGVLLQSVDEDSPLSRWLEQPARVGLHAFASLSNRCVPLATWVDLAQRLAARGWAVAWFGTRSELDRLRALPDVPGDFCDQLGDGTLAQSIPLLTFCQAYVGHDSGVLHLASATGGRTLGVFTPGEPLRTKAQGTGGGATFHRQDPHSVTAAELLAAFDACFGTSLPVAARQA